MERNAESFFKIDALAEEAGGYFALPSKENIEYTDLLFDVCEQFGIRYYSATPKERHFVEEVTRVTWAKIQEEKTGIKQEDPRQEKFNRTQRRGRDKHISGSVEKSVKRA